MERTFSPVPGRQLWRCSLLYVPATAGCNNKHSSACRRRAGKGADQQMSGDYEKWKERDDDSRQVRGQDRLLHRGASSRAVPVRLIHGNDNTRCCTAQAQSNGAHSGALSHHSASLADTVPVGGLCWFDASVSSRQGGKDDNKQRRARPRCGHPAPTSPHHRATIVTLLRCWTALALRWFKGTSPNNWAHTWDTKWPLNKHVR